MFIIYFTFSGYSSVKTLSILQRKYSQIIDIQFLYSKHRFWEIAAATIEDLAFGIRSSRVPDRVGRRVCLNEVSYAAAEKSEWRMALKI